MFENRGSPTRQGDLEKDLRQALSEQEARKRTARTLHRVASGFYAPATKWRFRAGADLFKDGLPVYSLDINGRKQAGSKLRQHPGVTETVKRAGQVISPESNLL